MTWPTSPAWLLEQQRLFGALLRSPLEHRAGSVRARTETYDAALVSAIRAAHNASAAERLAVYHRQYWFRLLTVLQRLYPLTARVLGFSRFNELAEAYLSKQPPSGFDVESIGEGFDAFVAETLSAKSTPPNEAACDAARIDAGFHCVLRAPAVAPFRPSQADAARLTDTRLALSPNVKLLEENFRLCEARHALLGADSANADADLDAAAMPPPERRSTPAHFLVARVEERIGLFALEPREAELLLLLRELPLGEALLRLEGRCASEEWAALPEKAQTWLARSVRLGVWAGFMTET